MALTHSVWTGLQLRFGCAGSFPAIFFWYLCLLHFLFSVQFEDGKTPLEAVHVGGGQSRTVIGLQVGVSCGFFIQQESLEGQKMALSLSSQTEVDKKKKI